MRAPSPGLPSFASPAFIAALALLVTNDFLLKPVFHNWATGKLSDFAGLFALAIFCATLSPRRRLFIGVVITAAFVFWKSGASQSLIDWVNGFAPFPVSRTVDYSDLWAVPAVGIGLWAARAIKPWPWPKAARVALGLFAAFAFTATSLPPPYAVHSTMELAKPSGAAASGIAVQAIFDDVAGKHALRCTICDPIGEGRVYTGSSAQTLTANFDEPTQTVYYRIVGPNDKRAAHKGVDRLSIDIRTALSNRFPELKLMAYVSGNGWADEPGLATTLTVHLDADELDVGADESAQRALSQIIEDTVREHELRIDASSLIYYAGKRMGPAYFDRELVLTAGPNSHASLGVSVTARSYAYEPMQQSLIAILKQRLDAAFGADRVTSSAPTE
jgi:hypothetical protein